MLTVQTAGEALNFYPHLHGCLTDGVFDAEGRFTRFAALNETELTRRFGEFCAAGLLKLQPIEASAAAQTLSQEHTGFSVWLGEPIEDSESLKFVARNRARGPLSLERRAVSEADVVERTEGEGSGFKHQSIIATICI